VEPRIYTYKITFPDTPYFYWGVHKEVKFGEEYWGSPVTNRWVWDFYDREKQVLECFPFTDEGWEEALQVEHRLILPDLNNPVCLNEGVGLFRSLESTRRAGRLGGISTSLIPGHMRKAGIASSKVRTAAKDAALNEMRRKGRESQKRQGIQIYGNDFEYYRRKGRLRRHGVKVDGFRIPINRLSETFIEYHLKHGAQSGGYTNP
jgi:hypothetical protein